MANRRKSKRFKLNKKTIEAAILIVALVVSAVFTYGRSSDGDSLWNKVYEQVGLTEQSEDEVYSSPLTVSFLDVGQGDSCIIHSDEFTMLIDSGVRYNEGTIAEELERLGASELDYVVCTHPHADHIGSMPEVFGTYNVGTVIMSEFDSSNLEDSTLYDLTLQAIQTNGAEIIYAVPGYTFDIGEAQFTVLGPVSQTDDPNNASVVLKMQYGERSFLFTGDAEAVEESDILATGADLSADVLKVGHHGSDSSSTYAFINAVKPSVGVISCGEDNEYGHPHQETLDVLSDFNVKVLRTDQLGTIVIGTDGDELSYSSNTNISN